MVEDAEPPSYRGVKCLHCRQPIPIPPLVADIEAQLKSGSAIPATHAQRQVFHVRCLVCGKEKPYKIAEILEFNVGPANLRAEPWSVRVKSARQRSASGQ